MVRLIFCNTERFPMPKEAYAYMETYWYLNWQTKIYVITLSMSKSGIELTTSKKKSITTTAMPRGSSEYLYINKLFINASICWQNCISYTFGTYDSSGIRRTMHSKRQIHSVTCARLKYKYFICKFNGQGMNI